MQLVQLGDAAFEERLTKLAHTETAAEALEGQAREVRGGVGCTG